MTLQQQADRLNETSATFYYYVGVDTDGTAILRRRPRYSRRQAERLADGANAPLVTKMLE